MPADPTDKVSVPRQAQLYSCHLVPNRRSCTRLTFPSHFVKTRIVRGAQLRKLSRVKDRQEHFAIAIGIMAVAVRLIAIDQPYIDNWSWRQGDVAAIARNYYENGFHFAYPHIDWAGDAPGYVGTEFPILPFLAAICYKFSGVHEWVGRIQAVIFFAASLPCFFLLVREISGELAATWALIFYSFAPLNVFAGRSFMPDVPSLSLAIIGLYFFLRWVENAAFAFRARARRGVRHKIRHAGAAFSLVARGDGCLHHRGWLRQPPSMVSIAARADRGRSRRRRVRICWLETDIAAGENWLVDLPGRLVCLARSQLCDLILPAGRSGITRCRFGIETNDAGKFVDRRGGLRRSDGFLLCATQRLAFPREGGHLRRQSGQQRTSDYQS